MERVVMSERVALGRIGKAHGLQGAFRVWPYADDTARFARLEKVVLTNGPRSVNARVCSVQAAGGFVIMRTDAIITPEDVRAWLGGDLEIDESDRIEPEAGRYFHDQLIGLTVVTVSGETVGTIAAILDMPANDVYVCCDGDREYLIPAVDEFVRMIDPAAGRMVIAPITGMIGETE
jgi:16S rRNA processing protein RimM